MDDYKSIEKLVAREKSRTELEFEGKCIKYHMLATTIMSAIFTAYDLYHHKTLTAFGRFTATMAVGYGVMYWIGSSVNNENSRLWRWSKRVDKKAKMAHYKVKLKNKISQLEGEEKLMFINQYRKLITGTNKINIGELEVLLNE